MGVPTMGLKATTCVAVIVAAVTIGSASAAPSTPIVYDGVLFFTALSSGCNGSGFPVGLAATSTYRPKLSSSNPAETLDFNFAVAGALISATNAAGSLRGSATFATTGISDRAFAYSNYTGSTAGGKSTLTFVPSNITTSTLNLTLTGTITDLYGASSCVITVRGVYTQRP